MTLVALSSNAEILKKTTGNGNQHVPVFLDSCYVQRQRKTGQDSLQVSQVNMLWRYNGASQKDPWSIIYT